MGAETWIPIAREFGIPAAFAVCFMAALGFIGWQVIKGFKWGGQRLIGETGIVTVWFGKQIELIDTIQKNDDRSTEAMFQLAEQSKATNACLEKMTAKEDSHILKSWEKWDAIHTDVRQVKEHTTKLAEGRGPLILPPQDNQ
jgi:hypothetical protein